MKCDIRTDFPKSGHIFGFRFSHISASQILAYNAISMLNDLNLKQSLKFGYTPINLFL